MGRAGNVPYAHINIPGKSIRSHLWDAHFEEDDAHTICPYFPTPGQNMGPLKYPIYYKCHHDWPRTGRGGWMERYRPRKSATTKPLIKTPNDIQLFLPLTWYLSLLKQNITEIKPPQNSQASKTNDGPFHLVGVPTVRNLTRDKKTYNIQKTDPSP